MAARVLWLALLVLPHVLIAEDSATIVLSTDARIKKRHKPPPAADASVAAPKFEATTIAAMGSATEAEAATGGEAVIEPQAAAAQAQVAAAQGVEAVEAVEAAAMPAEEMFQPFASTEPVANTLIVYAYKEGDPIQTRNLEFFVKTAVKASSDIDYVFVEMDAPTCGATKLLPKLPNVWLLCRKNAGMDLCAHTVVLSNPQWKADQRKHIFLMNGSARGPFIPDHCRYVNTRTMPMLANECRRLGLSTMGMSFATPNSMREMGMGMNLVREAAELEAELPDGQTHGLGALVAELEEEEEEEEEEQEQEQEQEQEEDRDKRVRQLLPNAHQRRVSDGTTDHKRKSLMQLFKPSLGKPPQLMQQSIKASMANIASKQGKLLDIKIADDWTERFKEALISPKVKLVGPYISCQMAPHVQSWFLATTGENLPLLRDNLKCYKEYMDTIKYGEVGVSNTLLEKGHMISSMITKYRGYDWLDPKTHACNQMRNPGCRNSFCEEGRCRSLTPIETVFWKNSGSLVRSNCLDHKLAKEVDELTSQVLLATPARK